MARKGPLGLLVAHIVLVLGLERSPEGCGRQATANLLWRASSLKDEKGRTKGKAYAGSTSGVFKKGVVMNTTATRGKTLDGRGVSIPTNRRSLVPPYEALGSRTPRLGSTRPRWGGRRCGGGAVNRQRRNSRECGEQAWETTTNKQVLQTNSQTRHLKPSTAADEVNPHHLMRPPQKMAASRRHGTTVNPQKNVDPYANTTRHPGRTHPNAVNARPRS
ncbi:hypothetical protein B0H16DRAFT_1454213 [Mycena metata]|uniref:Secreted protein n=1 Tax=Mycena metata TaxID=1033252 RepID=A0AAD7JIM2_9AGAR|nr:hypothetical protein B0H16DRAFT_1454213 [Mycena metata]